MRSLPSVTLSFTLGTYTVPCNLASVHICCTRPDAAPSNVWLQQAKDQPLISIPAVGFVSCLYTRTGDQVLQFSSVAQSCPTLCDSMDYSMPGFPVHHQLPELTPSAPQCIKNSSPALIPEDAWTDCGVFCLPTKPQAWCWARTLLSWSAAKGGVTKGSYLGDWPTSNSFDMAVEYNFYFSRAQ